MRRYRAVFALLLGLAGCRVFDPGLPATYDGEAPPPPPARDAAADARPDAPLPEDTAREVGHDEPGIPGRPEDVGCADGTREAFIGSGDWPDIAGCSGGWQVPGLLTPEARAPACTREGGNDGLKPYGEGCSVSDLCAAGWHVCVDASEVAHSSRTGCESAVTSVEPRFFLVLAGASPQGICTPDHAAANDLHGCGSLGDGESAACDPLTRRLTYAQCQATGAVWVCGSADDHLMEAAVVTKPDPALGGALCCRDN
jgi:hypothetical protein